eukprot:804507_1
MPTSLRRDSEQSALSPSVDCQRSSTNDSELGYSENSNRELSRFSSGATRTPGRHPHNLPKPARPRTHARLRPSGEPHRAGVRSVGFAGLRFENAVAFGKGDGRLFRHQRKLLVPGVAAYIKCLESLVEGSDRFPGTIIQFRKCVQHLGTLLDSLMKHSATQFMSQGGLPKLIRLFFHTDCHSPLPVTSPPAGGPDLCAAKFLVPALQNVGTRDNRDRSVLNDELAKALSALTAIINGSAPTHLSGRYLSYPTWPDEAPKLVDKIPEMDEDDTVKLCGPLTNSFERLRSSMVNLSRVECTMVLISKIIRRAPLQSYEQPSFSIVMDKLASTMPEALSALHEQDLTELKSSDAKISALHLRLVELSKQSTPVPDDKKERPDNWSNGSLRCGKKNHIVEVKEEKEEKISSDEFTGSKRK